MQLRKSGSLIYIATLMLATINVNAQTTQGQRPTDVMIHQHKGKVKRVETNTYRRNNPKPYRTEIIEYYRTGEIQKHSIAYRGKLRKVYTKPNKIVSNAVTIHAVRHGNVTDKYITNMRWTKVDNNKWKRELIYGQKNPATQRINFSFFDNAGRKLEQTIKNISKDKGRVAGVTQIKLTFRYDALGRKTGYKSQRSVAYGPGPLKSLQSSDIVFKYSGNHAEKIWTMCSPRGVCRVRKSKTIIKKDSIGNMIETQSISKGKMVKRKVSKFEYYP